MRGDDEKQTAIYSYVTMAQRIPADHPARQIRAMVDRALARMDAQLDDLYSTTGRPSIAPERLLRALLLMVLYSIRSERQLMEQLNYNLLFRWFVGLEMDDPVWDVTVTEHQLATLLGMGRYELDGFLKRREVWLEYSIDDLREEVETGERLWNKRQQELAASGK
jgi:transposase